MRYVTLVGSRDIPDEVRDTLILVGRKFAEQGYHGRSGFAEGSDICFFQGYIEAGMTHNFTNYIPWWGFRKKDIPAFYQDHTNTLRVCKSTQAESIASGIHPAWDRCSPAAKALHTRNVFQVLGDEINTPSRLLVCYANMDKHSDPVGGTRTAWMLAKNNNIPCKNLKDPNTMARCLDWLDNT